MITKEQAVILGNRGYGELHHTFMKNRDSSPVRCRINGKCKVWKTRPTEFRLPVKYGFKECFYITQANAHDWTVVYDSVGSY